MRGKGKKEMRGVKGGDCQRKTLQPCVRLMHLWRKRIVDPLEFEKRKKKCIHTKTRIRTHRLSAVGITTLSVCWLIHYSASPPFSFPICFSVSGLFAASAGLNTADSSSGDDRTAVNLKTHNGNT